MFSAEAERRSLYTARTWIPSTERRSLCDPETDRTVRRITEIERIETSLQEVRTYRKEKVRKWKESVS